MTIAYINTDKSLETHSNNKRNCIPSHIKRLLTDSRRITPGDIAGGDTAFVALRTRVGDGHRYIRQLYERGLRTFIVDSKFNIPGDGSYENARFIVTPDDTLSFIIREAGERLKSSTSRQIVVTGSFGKTTTKELLTRTLLKTGNRVRRSPRTWNSAMGLSLSLFECLAAPADYVINEIGIDAPGQAQRIQPMLRPYIGIITHITDEHDEAFENHAAKIAEKVAIVRNAERIVYIDSDPELCRQIRELGHPDAIGVKSIEEIIETITGVPCPAIDFSTRVEIREIPEDGLMVIDSFTNDLDSLPLSLALACQRQLDKKLSVFLGDFDGDRREAARIIAEKGGNAYFFDRNDSDCVMHLRRSDFARNLILIKGATEGLVTFFDEARHDTSLQIDLDAIARNYNAYRRLIPANTGIIGMVKADAYGHGAVEVGKTLQNLGADYLAVAVVDEGVALRRAGITMPVIVLNPITNRFDALIEYNLEPTAFSFDELGHLERGLAANASSKIPIHIKLDTGMHRVGFANDDLDRLAEHLNNSTTLRPATIFSHLATADRPDHADYTVRQSELFATMANQMRKKLRADVRLHLLNTAGIETRGAYHSDCYDLARLGLGLYGFSPLPDATSTLNGALLPAARLVTTVVALRRYPAGTSIGYGGEAITRRETTVATLPIGYADGINRKLGNGRGMFHIDSHRCPTIGNICMDLLMIDVTDALADGAEIRTGTQVEIFGYRQSAADIAKSLDTIPYEILTSVSPRVRRTYHFR